MLVPSGIDRDALVDLILTECSSFNVLYPDPAFFEQRLVRWSLRRLPIWQKLYNTTQYEYEPIYNYDRTEEHTETTRRTGTDTTETETEASHTGTVMSVGTNTETESKTAYNSDTLATAGQVTSNGNNTDTNNLLDTSTAEGTRTLDLTDTVTRRLKAYGNIGVTSTQQMIEQERAVDLFDVYGIILNDFIESFCVQVY